MAYGWNIFARQTDIGHSRTSVLNPVQWIVVILIFGAALLALAHAPVWLMIGIGVCAFGGFVLFVFSYIFFMIKDPDALRSESYSLQKLALQKGLVGDNLQGLIQADAISPRATAIVPFTAVQSQEQKEP